MLLDPLHNLWQMLILLTDIILFTQVDQVNNRLGCQEEERVNIFDLTIVVSVVQR